MSSVENLELEETLMADKKLAERCGVSFSRLRAAIPKVRMNTPSLKGDSCWNESGSKGWRAIMGCMTYLSSKVPPDTICEIIETENLDKVLSRVAFITDLTDPRTVNHPAEELQMLVKKFIVHLQDNKDHLLQTGYPKRRFLPSVWMDWRMTDLYRTKIPGKVTLRKGSDHVVECGYHWTDTRLPHPIPPSLNLGSPLALGMSKEYCFPPISTDFESLPLGDLLPYEEAPQMDGLTLHQAYQTERARPEIFDLKMDILAQLLDALERRDPDSLRDNCVKVIRERFCVAQVKFCWAMDMPKYLSRYPRSTTMSQVPVGPVCGGLNSLLSVMERAELELRSGLMGKIRASLGESFIITNSGARYFKTTSHWFSKEESDVIDESMRLYAKLLKKDAALHDEIHMKWNREMENKLLVEVSIKAKVPKSGVDETKEVFRNIAIIAEKAAKDAQAQGETLHSKPEHIGGGPENEFRREGSVWILTFNGKSIPVPHKRGFEYLQILIRNPGKTFSCTDLRSLAGKQRVGFDRLNDDMEDDSESNMPLAKTKVRDGDNKGLKFVKPSQLKMAKWTLEKQLKEADGELGPAEINKIQQRYFSVCNAIEELGPGYTGRERDRTYIGNSIKRAFSVLDDRHEELASHLDKYIERGFAFTYRPSPPCKWRVL